MKFVWWCTNILQNKIFMQSYSIYKISAMLYSQNLWTQLEWCKGELFNKMLFVLWFI